MTFIPLDANLRPFGAPPSKGRREDTASQTPHTDGFRYENAASPHSSFRAKARNLFRSRQGKGCERNGKREAPCSLRPPKRCFMQTVPHRKRNTANEKDPSAPLGMTIREYRFPQRRCEITIISFSRSICLGGLAALIGVTGKPYPSVFHTIVILSAPAGHLPLEGKAAIREYYLLKKGGEAATRALNLEP